MPLRSQCIADSQFNLILDELFASQITVQFSVRQTLFCILTIRPAQCLASSNRILIFVCTDELAVVHICVVDFDGRVWRSATRSPVAI